MENKTAMQELIDWIESWNGSFLDQGDIQDEAKNLLEKEKQDIIDSWEDGADTEYAFHINNVKKEEMAAEKYFNKTFKSN